LTIGGATRLVGLIGDPVEHSLSPLMQNAAFAAVALDWVYVPLPVKREGLEEAVAGLEALGFAGANVTNPHKTAVVGFCDELDDEAARGGSVNTLVVREGRVLGSSTDGPAVVGLVDAKGARVLVLGAGGGAQAVATSLGDAGAGSIAIAARDAERAHALAVRLRTLFPEREVSAEGEWPPGETGATLLVNATPIRDEVLVQPAAGQQVVDLAYKQDGSQTALVGAAWEAGCERIVDGLEVLLAQGAASFERWTGVEAPIGVMRAALAQDRLLEA
jgi:shikimate dehydrogenase